MSFFCPYTTCPILQNERLQRPFAILRTDDIENRRQMPPHGRLIDADVLMERFSYSPDDTLEDKYWIRAARRIIIDAPTIIGPEEGEL